MASTVLNETSTALKAASSVPKEASTAVKEALETLKDTPTALQDRAPGGGTDSCECGVGGSGGSVGAFKVALDEAYFYEGSLNDSESGVHRP